MTTLKDIKRIVEKYPQYKPLAFNSGFLITDAPVKLSCLELCDTWSECIFGNYHIWTHPKCHFFHFNSGQLVYFMIGHAFDPVNNQVDEIEILKSLATAKKDGIESYYTRLADLTGIYITGYIQESKIVFYPDAATMQTVYAGAINGQIYISSHASLVDYVTSLSRDPYVDSLVNYKYYRFFGAQLPGDLSPFLELKRVVSNFEYSYCRGKLCYKRFFPLAKIIPCASEVEYEQQISVIADLIEKTMELSQIKWGGKAALSLTGGRDSTTSLAGAHNILGELQCFSYISSEDERVDAEAAREIAQFVHVKHSIVDIDSECQSSDEIDAIGSIIEFNMGNIGRLKDKEIRKRVFFLHHPIIETEIKSWVDEIGRARYHKRYLMKQFPKKPKARYLTTMYKVFISQRALALRTDRIFREYLKKYYSDEIFKRVPWWDILYWEFSWGACEGLHTTYEHRLAYEVTIPYNNRFLLYSMLRIPLKKRIEDSIQIDVIQKLKPEILSSGVHIKDFGWNRKREYAERLYWEINTHLPF